MKFVDLNCICGSTSRISRTQNPHHNPPSTPPPSNVRSAVVELVKKLSKNLLTGNLDLLKVSLPVRIFEPRSYLEKLSDAWVYPRYLDAASACPDPVRRLKLVTTYFVAGFHRALQVWRKPFNPILGETWQASLPDGSRIFMEQISHHPPVSAYQIYGAGGAYLFNGTSEPSVSYRGSAMTTRSKGSRSIRFPDGGEVSVRYPTYELRGLIGTGVAHGDVSGTARFEDAAHGLTVTLRFGALDPATVGDDPLLARGDALCGVMERALPRGEEPAHATAGSAPRRAPFLRRAKGEVAKRAALPAELIPRLKADNSTSTYLTGKAMRGLALMRGSLSAASAASSASDADRAAATAAVPIAACTGNWLAFLDWDGERFWTLDRDRPGAWDPDPGALPSDCRYRQDLVDLIAGDFSTAQATKERMEQEQRHDAKLRKAGRKALLGED